MDERGGCFGNRPAQPGKGKSDGRLDPVVRTRGSRMAHVSRLIWLLAAVLWALLASNVARSADCPVDSSGYTPSSWNTAYTPTGTTWNWTHVSSGVVRCGISLNAQTNGSGSGYANMAAAQAALMASQTASGATQEAECTYDNAPAQQGVNYVFRNAAGSLHKAARIYTAVTTAECTPVEEPSGFDCGNVANVPAGGHADDMLDTYEPPETICVKNAKFGGVDTPMNCGAFKRAGQDWHRQGGTDQRDWLTQYQFTGLACDEEPEDTNIEDVEPDREKCTSSPSGLNWCESPQNPDDDCGFFNDKYVCLQSLGNDKCETKADGSRLCASSAPTPPVPDNGTNGVKATPNDTMDRINPTTNTTNTYNYYNSTTNAGSGRDTGLGGNTDGSGTVDAGGPAEGSDEEGADDEASGGITCDAEPTCSGDPIQCNLLMQQWRTRCPEVVTGTEALEAMDATEAEIAGDLGDGIADVEIGVLDATGIFGAAGACPAPIGVSVMGQSLDLDVWHAGCDMALLFAPFVMVMGYFAAAMLFVRDGGI